jgi:nickel superoxide dismutase
MIARVSRVYACIAVLPLTILLTTDDLQAHCQVPCGIYDDGARVAELREDARTIGKAIAMIGELAGKEDAQSSNQLARWVANKEQHAANIIEVVAEYFLAQRVKPVPEGADGHAAYLEKLGDHHAVIVAAMKTKQKADGGTVDALGAALDVLGSHYKEDH